VNALRLEVIVVVFSLQEVFDRNDLLERKNGLGSVKFGIERIYPVIMLEILGNIFFIDAATRGQPDIGPLTRHAGQVKIADISPKGLFQEAKRLAAQFVDLGTLKSRAADLEHVKQIRMS
jgi:hypothetical protein